MSKSLESVYNLGKTYVSIKKIVDVLIVILFAASMVAMAVSSHSVNGANMVQTERMVETEFKSIFESFYFSVSSLTLK